ncbi:adaptin, alpha/gamma/epsilon, putative [Entamoeba histolytica HM-3:IMSS]|uniref:Adaptor protein (AP) family protein n=4 Tax=Entamoeba histolytica TaxID=5759 RepID=C4LUG0_ENTH1|nr:adaptor protein (AP) family protein [Entamoeba histolytica HM-1:IMSS]EAL50499.2 adaptor protein (AP) family protein [Entamoeba histolytica HM-1:IMSS]EMD43465.1 adaptin alpha/gamma/epsilon, putative [Entamoeba histolytica KU27]EMS14239.1 adaptin, alpha/gamma/epsilon, putative [Entamoeba histolytica HM-3:IMSS]ENY62217.1 adaptin, alpha/gamma/epsilon, putative [Entamoeba histolytica HM-1:IMSS-A]|eukprot:XP_655885.2 adaptor protein (AP) family protein [Entamoeba histolytica HM-1:IMSS]
MCVTILLLLRGYIDLIFAIKRILKRITTSFLKQHNMNRTYANFVHDIGEKRTSDEERKFVNSVLKEEGNGLNNTSPSYMKEYIKKMMNIYELGYNVEQSLFMIINSTQHQNSNLQKTALIATSAIIPNDSEFSLLLTNSLTKLLGPTSTNPLYALRILSRFITSTTMPAYSPHINQLLKSKDPNIRAASIRSLYRIFLLSDHDSQSIIKSALSVALVDQSMIVVESAIPIITQIIKKIPSQYKGYKINDVCAPYLQIKLLRLLRIMNPSTKYYQQSMANLMEIYKVIPGGIGMALQIELIKTTMMCIPTDVMLRNAALVASTLFEKKDGLIIYCGLKTMRVISDRNPVLCKNHLDTIMKFINNDNDSVVEEAIELINNITESEEAVGVVLTLLDHVKKTLSYVDKCKVRSHILKVVYIICEKYTPDFEWYCNIVIHILEFNKVEPMQEGLSEEELTMIYTNFIEAMKSEEANYGIALQNIYNVININYDEITLSLAQFSCLIISKCYNFNELDMNEIRKIIIKCIKKGAVKEGIVAAIQTNNIGIIHSLLFKEKSTNDTNNNKDNNNVQIPSQPQQCQPIDLLNIWDIPQKTQQPIVEENNDQVQFDQHLINSIEVQQRCHEMLMLNQNGISYQALISNSINESTVEKQVLISEPINFKSTKKDEPALRFEEYKQESFIPNPQIYQSPQSSLQPHFQSLNSNQFEPKQESLQTNEQTTQPTVNSSQKKRWNLPPK